MARIGLVLGAGGLVGVAFHNGVARALTDSGIKPADADIIVGTSAGALVGASLRVGAGSPHPLTMRADPGGKARALSAWRSPRQRLSGLVLTPDLTNGRRSTDVISVPLRTRHGDRWPAAPLWLVAVRRGDGERVVFGRDGAPAADVPSAVSASCAIPAYFTPVDIGGVSYVDGGVYSPTNADLLAPYDLDLIVISSPMSMQPRAALRPRIDTGARLMFRRYLDEEHWVLRRPGTRVIRIEPDAPTLAAMGLNAMSDRRVDEVTDAAYALALRELGAVQREMVA